MLASRMIGAGRGPRTVLVHGFTQNSECWGRFGELLGASARVTAVDAPGHGESGHAEADLHEAGELLLDVGGAGHYLGYSMGGRMLLHAAVGLRAELIDSLVLIGATAGIDDVGDRRQRRQRDDELADLVLELGTEAFVDRWLAGPLFAELTPEQACRNERLTNDAAGLAESLRRCGTGRQEPLWDRLSLIGEIGLPVLVIAGRDDHKFGALGRRLAAAIGDTATFASVAGGHAVHLENPSATAELVLDWRDALRSG